MTPTHLPAARILPHPIVASLEHLFYTACRVRWGHVMSANSSIEWTDHTFNPWWGCVKVSPGCEHCYAENLSARYGHRVWGPAKTTTRRLFGETHWSEPIKWNSEAERLGVRRRVFCASMADVFEDHPEVASARARLWTLIPATPWLDWLILTKRPERIRTLVPTGWLDEPCPNVWYGTSVEDQLRADERIPHLARVPAAVRFLSCEPLVGPVRLPELLRIDWVIVGGESGPGARRMDPAWALSLREQCEEASAAYFFKQAGSVLATELGMAGKGGHELTRLPRELRVRDYPTCPRRATPPIQTGAQGSSASSRELQPA
jgi:protein gp37